MVEGWTVSLGEMDIQDLLLLDHVPTVPPGEMEHVVWMARRELICLCISMRSRYTISLSSTYPEETAAGAEAEEMAVAVVQARCTVTEETAGMEEMPGKVEMALMEVP
jgi:hypothetical protein